MAVSSRSCVHGGEGRYRRDHAKKVQMQLQCEILKEGPNQKGLSVSGFLWILALAAAMDHILMKVSRGSISTI
ncbi:hypothetical protein V6N11_009260 [Hibiscus sabdariffa]|uniref:Uncharacterized protein n=1 Tax=Hibiscus sabdariffa TaxID=183260 RepID=A0ABR2PQ48_9ROSI